MATPNYGYEKRQKELAKKQKKAEKLKEKNERKSHGPDGDSVSHGGTESDATPDTSPDNAG